MNNYYYLFFFIQNNLNTEVFEKLFENDYKHYEYKWISTNYNLLNFMDLLDTKNQNKLVEWGLKNYSI